MWTAEQIVSFASDRGEPFVSVFLPTHRRGPDVRGDPIRLKNLITEVRARADELDVDRDELSERVAPLESLLEDSRFWQHQGDGLALFASSAGMDAHRLPFRVEEHVYVGDRRCVRPLLPAIEAGSRFYVLALSQRAVRLVECSRNDARELDLHDIPKCLCDVVGYDWKEKSLQFHTGSPVSGGARAAMFHGHGRPVDDAKDEITRFLRRVDEGVLSLLPDRTPPLVIAAVDYLIPMYHEISGYPNRVAAGVTGNPERVETRDLHASALELVRPLLDAERHTQLEKVHAALHSEKAVAGLEPVLSAATAGRVATLLVHCREPIWGREIGDGRKVEIHARRQPGDDDLLDLAIARSVRTGAAAHAVSSEELPADTVVAATLRY